MSSTKTAGDVAVASRKAVSPRQRHSRSVSNTSWWSNIFSAESASEEPPAPPFPGIKHTIVDSSSSPPVARPISRERTESDELSEGSLAPSSSTSMPALDSMQNTPATVFAMNDNRSMTSEDESLSSVATSTPPPRVLVSKPTVAPATQRLQRLLASLSRAAPTAVFESESIVLQIYSALVTDAAAIGVVMQLSRFTYLLGLKFLLLRRLHHTRLPDWPAPRPLTAVASLGQILVLSDPLAAADLTLLPPLLGHPQLRGLPLQFLDCAAFSPDQLPATATMIVLLTRSATGTAWSTLEKQLLFRQLLALEQVDLFAAAFSTLSSSSGPAPLPARSRYLPLSRCLVGTVAAGAEHTRLLPTIVRHFIALGAHSVIL
jgi:hypothetical protein